MTKLSIIELPVSLLWLTNQFVLCLESMGGNLPCSFLWRDQLLIICFGAKKVSRQGRKRVGLWRNTETPFFQRVYLLHLFDAECRRYSRQLPHQCTLESLLSQEKLCRTQSALKTRLTQSNARQVKPTSGAPAVKAPINLSAMDRTRELSSRQSLLRQKIQRRCTFAAAKKQRTCHSVMVLTTDSTVRDWRPYPSPFSHRLFGINLAGIETESMTTGQSLVRLRV